MSALAADPSLDLAQLPFRDLRRGRSGSRGTTGARRGRHIRSTPGDPRRARIDIQRDAAAAAPWQQIRQSDKVTSDRVAASYRLSDRSPCHPAILSPYHRLSCAATI